MTSAVPLMLAASRAIPRTVRACHALALVRMQEALAAAAAKAGLALTGSAAAAASATAVVAAAMRDDCDESAIAAWRARFGFGGALSSSSSSSDAASSTATVSAATAAELLRALSEAIDGSAAHASACGTTDVAAALVAKARRLEALLRWVRVLATGVLLRDQKTANEAQQLQLTADIAALHALVATGAAGVWGRAASAVEAETPRLVVAAAAAVASPAIAVVHSAVSVPHASVAASAAAASSTVAAASPLSPPPKAPSASGSVTAAAAAGKKAILSPAGAGAVRPTPKTIYEFERVWQSIEGRGAPALVDYLQQVCTCLLACIMQPCSCVNLFPFWSASFSIGFAFIS